MGNPAYSKYLEFLLIILHLTLNWNKVTSIAAGLCEQNIGNYLTKLIFKM